MPITLAITGFIRFLSKNILTKQNKDTPVNKSELVSAIAKEADITKEMSHRVLDATLKSIESALKAGEQVSLVGFGSFLVRERAARLGRNPKTGEPMQIKASKSPVFKAGKLLKDSVN
jgi:DNA-binding protein HU-beta